ncbi:MAG: carbohydrate-binding protein [Saprospiraceae bacterium]|nr:carbohydrate-binding protein [Saprospiraceae bacterium]
MSGKIVFISSLKQVDHPIFTNKICSKKTKGRMINRLKPFLLIFIFIHLLPLKNQAQDFLQTSGKAIINSTTGDTVILRGMGLGGWMLQEGYMLQTASFANAQYKIKQHIEDLIGTTGMELFYEKWLENHVTKTDIDSLASWGFNSVRLPMHYNLYTLPIEDEPLANENTWLDKGFIMTDSLISWCKQNDMWVILDLHAAPGGQGYDEGISDYDITKPSLWESTENQNKTVALWKRLAERYADEPTIAGYDLINEVNWNLPGGTLLRNLYGEITDSIRVVDNNHIIFIEGNWFANDFTGLTPPWDENLVYAPHKYWSFNDQASIQWVLDIRNTYNVPLYLGESGENSNVWFRDAIKLLEDNDIGWAWWPMKKIEAIAGPLSITKTGGYQTLLNYWEGNGTAPSIADATTTLMDLTEKIKIENCFFQKDVVDAMFRQVQTDETKPFSTQNIPGTVFSSDFDLGRNGFAYSDSEVANYHVSTGNYTSWNSGWHYRNDGVDLEPSFDQINSNGHAIGFTATDEWIQYEVNVTESAVYEVELRIANGSTDGAFHFSVDGANISTPYYVQNTGGYQNWETLTIQNVILTPQDKKLKLHVDEGGFNVGSFTFNDVMQTTEVTTDFFSAVTLDESSVELVLNKPLTPDFIDLASGMQFFINGTQVLLTDVQPSPNNPRIIIVNVDDTFVSSDVLKISYTGIQIVATDGTLLENFIQKPVNNTVATIHPVPGKMEAEEFYFQTGMEVENCLDNGFGQNLSFLDAGDYAEYTIDVAQSGIYQIDYRTSSNGSTGALQLLKLNNNGNTSLIHGVTFPQTGGWQTWETTGKTVFLESGRQNVRIKIVQSNFNLNWIEFTSIVGTENLDLENKFSVYPNPNDGLFYVDGNLEKNQNVNIYVYNIFGQMILSKNLNNISTLKEKLNLDQFESGNYFIQIQLEDGKILNKKISKL